MCSLRASWSYPAHARSIFLPNPLHLIVSYMSFSLNCLKKSAYFVGYDRCLVTRCPCWRQPHNTYVSNKANWEWKIFSLPNTVCSPTQLGSVTQLSAGSVDLVEGTACWFVFGVGMERKWGFSSAESFSYCRHYAVFTFVQVFLFLRFPGYPRAQTLLWEKTPKIKLLFPT